MVSTRSLTAPGRKAGGGTAARRLAVALAAWLALAGGASADLSLGVQRFEQGDYEGAAAALEPEVAGGDARAQYLLGVMYLNELVAPPNRDAAVHLLRSAAEQDHVEAQTELARMYRTGDGVPQDYAQMALWYGRAAELGDVGAQLFIADSYAYGFGVLVDYVQAYMWYEIAVQYWGPLATRARDVIAEKMTPEEIAEASALAARRLSAANE